MASYERDIEGFGEGIKIMRCRKKLTQAALARMAHVSKKYLVEVEQGKHSVGIKVILKLCKALGVNRFELLILSWEKEYQKYLEAVSANSARKLTRAAAKENHCESARRASYAESQILRTQMACGGGQGCYNWSEDL